MATTIPGTWSGLNENASGSITLYPEAQGTEITNAFYQGLGQRNQNGCFPLFP